MVLAYVSLSEATGLAPSNARIWVLTTAAHVQPLAPAKGRKLLKEEEIKAVTWEGAEEWINLQPVVGA